MATYTLSAINAALAQFFFPKITSQVNRACALLQLLPYRPGSGKNLAFDARVGTDAPADMTLAEGNDVSTFNSDTLLPATLAWGSISDAFKVTGKAQDAASSTGNPEEIIDLIEESMRWRIEAVAKGLNREFLSGDGSTNHVNGLTAANGPLDAVGTYAGIDRATYPQWGGNVVDFASVGGDAIDAMRAGRRAAFNRSGSIPDLWLCDMYQWDQYAAAAETKTQRRAVQDVVNVRGQRITLDAGYSALDFEGKPVLPDVDMPAGTMLGLNTQYLAITQLIGGKTKALIQQVKQLMGTPDAMVGPGTTQLMVKLQALAIGGDYLPMQLICYPQLLCEKPNAQVWIQNLPTS